MHRWVGKIAVVTGASSGIGEAISKGLVKAGVSVVGLARRAERLEKLSSTLKGTKGKFYPRQCDVTKEEDLSNSFKWVNAELGGADILVNNAGFGRHSKILDDDNDSLRKVLDTNVLAMAICTREAVASLKERDVPGHIINMNSVLGHQKFSGRLKSSLYLPSKWAVTAMTELVRQELHSEPKNKIKITSISPGLVKTEMFDESGVADIVYKSGSYLDAEDVSDAVIYVLGTQDKVVISEVTIHPVGGAL